MAKSTSLTAAQINKLLKFNPDWIKDPVPPFRKNLDQATLRKIAQAKVAFGKEINTIVRNRPR
jgi:L-alanine-DL-glutamate epimerase-like enolase superfamily enzyme